MSTDAILVFLVLLTCGLAWGAADPGNATLIDSIIEAQEAGLRAHPQGVGRAAIKRTVDFAGTPPGGSPTKQHSVTETIASFRFKGDSERLEEFARDQSTGRAGRLKSVLVRGTETFTRYFPDVNRASTESVRNSPLDHVVGDDFKPYTFNALDNNEFGSCLRGLAASADHFEPTIDDQGLMTIKAGASHGNGEQWEWLIVLNPKIDYCVLECSNTHITQAYVRTVTYKANWQENGALYPKSVLWREESKQKPGFEAMAPSGQSVVEVEILDFDPSAEVSDSDFTIDSIGMPAGTLVVDHVADLTYPYGATESQEAKLENVLGDLTADVNAPAAAPTSTAEKPAPAGVSRAAVAHSYWPAVMRIAIAALLLAAALLLLLLRKRG